HQSSRRTSRYLGDGSFFSRSTISSGTSARRYICRQSSWFCCAPSMNSSSRTAASYRSFSIASLLFLRPDAGARGPVGISSGDWSLLGGHVPPIPKYGSPPNGFRARHEGERTEALRTSARLPMGRGSATSHVRMDRGGLASVAIAPAHPGIPVARRMRHECLQHRRSDHDEALERRPDRGGPVSGRDGVQGRTLGRDDPRGAGRSSGRTPTRAGRDPRGAPEPDGADPGASARGADAAPRGDAPRDDAHDGGWPASRRRPTRPRRSAPPRRSIPRRLTLPLPSGPQRRAADASGAGATARSGAGRGANPERHARHGAVGIPGTAPDPEGTPGAAPDTVRQGPERCARPDAAGAPDTAGALDASTEPPPSRLPEQRRRQGREQLSDPPLDPDGGYVVRPRWAEIDHSDRNPRLPRPVHEAAPRVHRERRTHHQQHLALLEQPPRLVDPLARNVLAEEDDVGLHHAPTRFARGDAEA